MKNRQKWMQAVVATILSVFLHTSFYAQGTDPSVPLTSSDTENPTPTDPLPNCYGEATLTAVRKGCFDYELTLQTQYITSILSHTWFIDGNPVLSPTNALNQILPNLATGPHQICIKIRYICENGMECELTICTNIDVPLEVTDTEGSFGIANLYYCPIGQVMVAPNYNPCDFCTTTFPSTLSGSFLTVYSNGQFVLDSFSNPEEACLPRPVGIQDEVVCYDQREDGSRCIRKSTSIQAVPLPVTTVTAPSLTLRAENCEQLSIDYVIDCEFPYTDYKVIGPDNSEQSGSLQSSLVTISFTASGEYLVECYDLQSCTKSVREITVIIPGPMVYSECRIDVPDCSVIENSDLLIQQLERSDCRDCAATIAFATSVGPWTPVDSPFQFYRTLTREYVDAVNCKRCLLTIDIPMTGDPAGYFQVSEDSCRWITRNDLPACLRNGRPVKMAIMGNGVTLPLGEFNLETVMRACCENPYGIANPMYYFYSEDDPCCYFALQFQCVRGAPVKGPESANINATLADPIVSQQLWIVPNPSSSVCRIASSNGYETYDKVEIRDGNGRALLSLTHVDSTTELDISSLAKGTYSVIVTRPSGTSVLKLITIP